jgi:transposase
MPPPSPPSELALLRYQIISAYLSLDRPRGQRRTLLEHLASQRWALPDGREVHFAAATLRGWVRKFRKGGLAALENAPRPAPGVQVLDEAQKALLCRLKRDVPARSVERVIEIAEETGLIEPGLLKRSTVHRALQSRGLSARKKAEASTSDLDRFEAAFPNDLWQSDMLCGPWLPDPDCLSPLI